MCIQNIKKNEAALKREAHRLRGRGYGRSVGALCQNLPRSTPPGWAGSGFVPRVLKGRP
ncbi:hypothetical protein [Azospirillum doebereinerae]